MKKKTANVYKTIMLVILTAIITFILTMVFMGNLFTGSSVTIIGTDEGDSKLLTTLHMFKKLIDDEYVGGDINEEALIEGAIKGYVSGLGDKYSTYYTASEMSGIVAQTEGNYLGVGLYIASDLTNDMIYIWPMPNSPAEKAGIQNQDILLKVNDVEYHAENSNDAVKVLKQGYAGEKVTIQVKREEEILDFELEKAIIILTHIGSSKMLDDEIGYIKIEDFDGGTADEFKENYDELVKKGMKRLIIDIRGNGGGVVDEAVKICDFFLEKDKIVLIEQGKDTKQQVETTKEDKSIDIPTVIVMNEQSASAAEIFAAAMQENDVAKLVGVTTYGKGVIQTLRQFTDGSGLKLTTREFFTPKHNQINHLGIKPDVESKLSAVAAAKPILEEKEDTQLQDAIETVKK